MLKFMKFKTIIWIGTTLFSLGLAFMMLSNVVDWFIVLTDILLPTGGGIIYVL